MSVSKPWGPAGTKICVLASVCRSPMLAFWSCPWLPARFSCDQHTCEVSRLVDAASAQLGRGCCSRACLEKADPVFLSCIYLSNISESRAKAAWVVWQVVGLVPCGLWLEVSSLAESLGTGPQCCRKCCHDNCRAAEPLGCKVLRGQAFCDAAGRRQRLLQSPLCGQFQ